MPLNIRESIPLGRFVYESKGTPLKGTHILPLMFFDLKPSLDPNDYLEVVRVISVSGTDVAITRGSGIFVRDHGEYSSREGIDALTGVFNLLLAEFALQGLISHPVTDVEIQSATLMGRHATITGGGGTTFADRTWGPYSLLTSSERDIGPPYRKGDYRWPPHRYWILQDPKILDRVDGVRGAMRLREFSPTLPALFLAAVYNTLRHNLAECIVTSWIVCEQLLSFLWDEYVSAMGEKDRRDRLGDTRTYGASVRLEVLLVAGVIDSGLYKVMHEARKIRNALAHRAVLGQDAAAASASAMQKILAHVGIVANLPGYMFSMQSAGPYEVLEPEFEFK